MTVTNAQLSEQIAEACQLNNGQAAKTLDALLEIIKKLLIKGDDVLIPGFGKFCVKKTKKRRGRNHIPAKTSFYPQDVW